MKGTIQDNILVKRGKLVVKFFKHNGYAVPVKDLEQVRGVKLYTKYDGILYADRHVFHQHGLWNDFKGEEQLILPVKYWEVLHELSSR